MPKTKEKEKFLTMEFNATLINKEIREAFIQFLSTEKNTNNWNFILLAHLLGTHIEKKKYKHAIETMNSILHIFFIQETIKLQLKYQNSQEICFQIQKCWKNKKFSEVSTLIDLLKDILIQEYHKFFFPKFLSLPKSLKLIEKFRNDEKIIIPKITQIYEYTDDDFIDGKITQKDIDFFDEISNEKSFAQPDIKVDNVGLLFSNYNYLPKLTFIDDAKIIKFDIIFNYPLEQTACVLFDNCLVNDPQLTNYDLLKYHPNDYFIIQCYSNTWGIVPTIRKSVYSIKYQKKKIDFYVKPMKIKDIDFHQYQMLDIKGTDGKVEKKLGIQEFHFSHVELIQLEENKTLMKANLFLGLGKKAWGIPKNVLSLKFHDYYTKNLEKLKKTCGRETIDDYKKRFTRMKNGIPLDPVGNLVYEVHSKLHKKENENPKKQNCFLENILLQNDLEIMATATQKIEVQKETKLEEQCKQFQNQLFLSELNVNSKLNMQLGAFGNSIFRNISKIDELVSFIEDESE
eukprot:gene10232-2652_t